MSRSKRSRNKQRNASACCIRAKPTYAHGYASRIHTGCGYRTHAFVVALLVTASSAQRKCMVGKAGMQLSTGLCKACPHRLWISRRSLSRRGQKVSSTTQVYGDEGRIRLMHTVMQAVSTFAVD